MYQQPLLAVGKQALQRQEGEAEGKGNVTVYGTEKKLWRQLSADSGNRETG